MAEVIKLLIIEDEPIQVQNYGDAIDGFNDENRDNVSIEYEDVDNAESAISKLSEYEYDAVIVDLILIGDTPGQGRMSGNKVLDFIFKDNGPRLMVHVVSGNTNRVI